MINRRKRTGLVIGYSKLRSPTTKNDMFTGIIKMLWSQNIVIDGES